MGFAGQPSRSTGNTVGILILFTALIQISSRPEGHRLLDHISNNTVTDDDVTYINDYIQTTYGVESAAFAHIQNIRLVAGRLVV